MPQPLPVPYHPQIADGYCLAACAQMVLHYWGINRGQEQIASQLGVISHVGIPASRIKQLISTNINVVYDIGEWDILAAWLDKDVPLLAAIQAGELAYWQGEVFPHMVVVIGYDGSDVWLLDPAAQSIPVTVTIDEFMLAWGEMDYRYAVLERRSS